MLLSFYRAIPGRERSVRSAVRQTDKIAKPEKEASDTSGLADA